jgi:hypothetical protein
MDRHLWSVSGFVTSLAMVVVAVVAPLAAAAALTGTVTDTQGKVVVNASC